MRLLPISLVILAGAIMTSAGVIADAIDTKHNYDVKLWGLGVVLVGGLLFVIDFFKEPAESTIPANTRTEMRVGSS